MKKLKRVLVGLLILFVVAGIAAVATYGPRFGIYLIPPTPQQYVEDALSFADFGIYANGDDWHIARASAIEHAADCETFEETYPIIQEALNTAGGKHSVIRSKAAMVGFAEEQTLPTCSIEDGILYIKLPPYSMDSGKSNDYANTVLEAIEQSRSNIRGVILDLRDNTGGDMGPMVAAVSPLLDDGIVLQFDISGQMQEVTLSEGAVSGGGSNMQVDAAEKLHVPIVVLQNEMTASSGEAVLLCFKGMKHVRFFGTDSAGYCSVNTIKTLYDGAVIQLTIGSDVDRTGQAYCEDPIPPDVYTRNPLEDATAWIVS